jgi:pyrroloquinoline quinone (PQQ) biosynthesis protein C
MGTLQGTELEWEADIDQIPPPEDIVARFREIDVASHPFFVTLADGSAVDLEAIYLLISNLHQGVSGSFVRWLAIAISRTDDRRVASLLARQLNDELGDGDFTQIHSVLLDRFVIALSPWCDRAGDHQLLSAGRRLARDGARPFVASDPQEGLGALIVSGVFAEKMDVCLAGEMRRQMLVTGEAMRWLNVHETMETNHAQDSHELAELLPRAGSGLAAAWRGALDQWDALWQFLDDVHELRTTLQPECLPSRFE